MTDQPFAVMIAGPNGSGKTTLTRELIRRGVDLGVYINPDDIASALEGDDVTRARNAQREADARREKCIRARQSFSFETVMSHPSKIDVLKQAKTAGFAVVLYFISTEGPDLNVARVQQRVVLGGHDVPADRIVARYHRAMALLPAAIDEADRLVLFDNSYRADPTSPIVLRPFLILDRTSIPVMRVEHPIPQWGRPIIESIQATSIDPS